MKLYNCAYDVAAGGYICRLHVRPELNKIISLATYARSNFW